ncbi:MAG: hypothetical protein KGI57_09805 [Hyphomicrobiales bacterium]|nr:hypothetical protein [Hyphomicrobiales bacterium]
MIVSASGAARGGVFDLRSPSGVNGTLECAGAEFLRFELRIPLPAAADGAKAFDAMQVATLHAALGWNAARISATLSRMNAEAQDYLRASKQRGDVYYAGKTESHEPGGVSLGLIYTDGDRALIVVGPAAQ